MVGHSQGRTLTGQNTHRLGHSQVRTLKGQDTQRLGHSQGRTLKGQDTQRLGHSQGRTHTGQDTLRLGHSKVRKLTGQETHRVGHSQVRTLKGQDSQRLGHSQGRTLTGQDTQMLGHSHGRKLTGQETHRVPSVIQQWNSLPCHLRQCPSPATFKRELLRSKFPTRTVPLHFLHGARLLSSLHARMRNNCSNLKCNLFVNHLSETNLCEYCNIPENAYHYFFSLYTVY